jgi:hypothetical protein
VSISKSVTGIAIGTGTIRWYVGTCSVGEGGEGDNRSCGLAVLPWLEASHGVVSEMPFGSVIVFSWNESIFGSKNAEESQSMIGFIVSRDFMSCREMRKQDDVTTRRLKGLFSAISMG